MVKGKPTVIIIVNIGYFIIPVYESIIQGRQETGEHSQYDYDD